MRIIRRDIHHQRATTILLLPNSDKLTTKPQISSTIYYILRHSETDANAAGIILGSTDISRLTATGQNQARAIGYTMALAMNPPMTEEEDGTVDTIQGIDQIFVSPLTRARDTLQLIRAKSPQHFLPASTTDDITLQDLREIDLYLWEYQPGDVLQQQYPTEYAAWKAGNNPDTIVIDGHYPLHELWARADTVWKDIRTNPTYQNSSNDRDGTSNTGTGAKLIVCHGTLGQALLGTVSGKDATTFRQNMFPNCGMA